MIYNLIPDNREFATIIIIAIFFIAGLILSKKNGRAKILRAFSGIAKAFFIKVIIIITILYFLYAAIIIWCMYSVGFWNYSLLKDTIVITISMYLYMMSIADSIKSEIHFVKSNISSVIGVNAILIFYINVIAFSLIAEIILQFIIIITILFRIFASADRNNILLKRLTDLILFIIGVVLIVKTTKSVIENPIILTNEYPSFILSILLSLLIVPFIYVLAVIIKYDTLFWQLKSRSYKRIIRLKIEFALIIKLRFSTLYISEFNGKWLAELSEFTKFFSILKFIGSFREEVKLRKKEEQLRKSNLRKNKGNKGIDEEGKRLDRREFHITKKVLIEIYYMEMRQNRILNNHYDDTIVDKNLSFLSKKIRDDLPDEHGIHLVLSEDKTKYCAWRQTISGFYFAIGGTKDLEKEWQYAGETPPNSFPNNEELNWVNHDGNTSHIEWLTDDSPKFDDR